MSNPIQALLNKMIKNMLPKINSGIQGAIKNNHLDPWGQVAHGSDRLGSINLGIATVSAYANYNIGRMTGLSSFTINSLQIQSVEADPNDAAKLTGHMFMSASLNSNLSAHAGGGIKATFKNFIHNISQSVGIGGTANVSGVTANATGSFTASVNGNKVCLDSVHISTASVDYGSINVSIDGLGFFNSLLSPLTDAFVNLFKGQIRSAISSAVTPVINSQVNKVMPQCQNL